MPKKEMIETGKNVDAAIDSACEKLECSRDECEWEIIDLPKKGFLGLKSTPAKVRVSIEIPEEIKSAEYAVSVQNTVIEKTQEERRKPEPLEKEQTVKTYKSEKRKFSYNGDDKTPSVYSEEKIHLAENYLSDILEKMGLEAELNIQKEDGVTINIDGRGLGSIIGRRGETLDAIQYLTSLVANRSDDEYMRITIDCGDYRTKRRDTLESLARKLASQVLKTNVSRTLEPMNPFERRIIHAAVSEIEGVTSISTGEEPNRRVVITSPTAKHRSGGVRRDFQRSGKRDFQPREQNVSDEADTPKREYQGQRDRGAAYGDRDRRPQRRDGHRDNRRDSRSSAVIKSDGPPKQTPEAVSTDKPLYTKIDL